MPLVAGLPLCGDGAAKLFNNMKTSAGAFTNLPHDC